MKDFLDVFLLGSWVRTLRRCRCLFDIHHAKHKVLYKSTDGDIMETSDKFKIMQPASLPFIYSQLKRALKQMTFHHPKWLLSSVNTLLTKAAKAQTADFNFPSNFEQSYHYPAFFHRSVLGTTLRFFHQVRHPKYLPSTNLPSPLEPPPTIVVSGWETAPGWVSWKLPGRCQ